MNMENIPQQFSFPTIRQEDFQRAVSDIELLEKSLADADIVPQLLLHAQLSGDDSLLSEAQPYITGAWNYMESIPEGLRNTIRARLVEILKQCAKSGMQGATNIPGERLKRMLSVAIGETLPDEHLPLVIEDFWKAKVEKLPGLAMKGRSVPQDFRVIIAGAGLSGICLAIHLREAGIPFVIYEKNSGVGGSWFENTYPGAAADVPVHFYSFTFEPNPHWTRHFARQDELQAYLERCIDKYGIRECIEFNTEVQSATFDAERSLWKVSTRNIAGETSQHDATIFVTAVGQLNRPKYPDIEGLDNFEGPVFHSAQWDHGQDLSGKHVALIGTGASSMQIGPAIADEVERLMIFQRSPAWAVKDPNYHLEMSEGMKWALANVPMFQNWYRFLLGWAGGDSRHAALQVDPDWTRPELSINVKNEEMRVALIKHIEAEIGDDPALLAKVIPNYPPLGKRLLRENNWYKMLKRPHVDLIDDGVAKVERDSIVTSDGRVYPTDVIILATGFHSTRMLWPMSITGRSGAELSTLWGEDDPRAYLGMTVPDFPNMAMLYGPNTNHGIGSIFFHAECQVRYIMQLLFKLLDDDYAQFECRTAPFLDYNNRVDDAHSRMVWTHRGTNNWFRNSKGRVVSNSPWRLVDYWRMTHELQTDDFIFRRHPADKKRLSARVPDVVSGIDSN